MSVHDRTAEIAQILTCAGFYLERSASQVEVPDRVQSRFYGRGAGLCQVGGRVPWTRRPGRSSTHDSTLQPDYSHDRSLAWARPRHRSPRLDGRSPGSASAPDLRPSGTPGRRAPPGAGPSRFRGRAGRVPVPRLKERLPVATGPGHLPRLAARTGGECATAREADVPGSREG